MALHWTPQKGSIMRSYSENRELHNPVSKLCFWYMGYLEDHPTYIESSWSTVHNPPWCGMHFFQCLFFWGGVGCGVGMMTFLGLAHMVDATQVMGWGGVGWWRSSDLHAWSMLRKWWGGVGWGGWGGWGGDDDVPRTCTHGRCYASRGVGGGVGMMTFLGLARMVDAIRKWWGGVGWGGVGDDDVPRTCTHGRCHASHWGGGVGWGWWRSSDLHAWSMLRKSWGGVGGGVGMMTFLGLARMVDATQVMGWLASTMRAGWGWWRSSDLHAWSMLRKSWGGVGGGVGMMTFLGLAHMVDATQVMGWWGGVGMMTFLGLARMVDATQVMGWGGAGGFTWFWRFLRFLDDIELFGCESRKSTTTSIFICRILGGLNDHDFFDV